MTSVHLSEELLDVIVLIHRAKWFFLSESSLINMGQDTGLVSKPDENWKDNTRRYFFGLNTEHLQKLNLKKNEFCFLAIIDFQVSDEMLSTPFDQLHKFTFSY